MPPTPSPSSPAEYVLGTNPDETRRLGLQHRLWSAAAHAAWERAGIGPGMSVLDVGCGPGHAAADLAQIVGPGGRVVGVDESEAFVAEMNAVAASRGHAHLRAVQGNVQDLAAALPGERASFDLAYARWVLCFVPDPLAVLRGVARLLKPGGRLVVQDYFAYESMTLAPKHPAFTRAIDAVGASWRQRGGDPDIVGRLPSLLAAVGLRLEHLSMNPRIARPGSTMWHWPDSFWRNFIPVLVKLGLLTESDEREFFDAWRAASADPHAFMLLPPVFDVMAVKP